MYLTFSQYSRLKFVQINKSLNIVRTNVEGGLWKTAYQTVKGLCEINWGIL
jgi:hypothetical protein